jgi:hypothetical protein
VVLVAGHRLLDRKNKSTHMTHACCTAICNAYTMSAMCCSCSTLPGIYVTNLCNAFNVQRGAQLVSYKYLQLVNYRLQVISASYLNAMHARCQ